MDGSWVVSPNPKEISLQLSLEILKLVVGIERIYEDQLCPEGDESQCRRCRKIRNLIKAAMANRKALLEDLDQWYARHPLPLSSSSATSSTTNLSSSGAPDETT